MVRYFVLCAFLLTSLVASGQKFLKTMTDSTQIFCGPSNFEFEAKGLFKRHVILKTEKGNLDLRGVKKLEPGIYRGKNQEDDVTYVIYTIRNELTNGLGLIFIPERSYMITYVIANRPLCGN